MRVRQMATELADLIEQKNRDYGDSYYKTRNKYGQVAFMIRIEDKLSRLESIINGTEINFESMEDTMLDMAGYILLEMNYLLDERDNQPVELDVTTWSDDKPIYIGDEEK